MTYITLKIAMFSFEIMEVPSYFRMCSFWFSFSWNKRLCYK